MPGLFDDLRQTLATKPKGDLIKEYIQKSTPADIDCATRAQSMEELEKCGSKNKKTSGS